jgi:hypothetical protein
MLSHAGRHQANPLHPLHHPHLNGVHQHGQFEYGLDTLLTGLHTTHTNTSPS